MRLLSSPFLNSVHFKISKPLWQCYLELHLLQKTCLSLEFSSVLIQEFPSLFSESVSENTDRTKLSFNSDLELKTINQPTLQNVLSFPIFSYIILKKSTCNWHVMVKLYHKSLWQLYKTLHPSRCTYRIFLLNRTHQFTYSFKVRHNSKLLLAQKGYLCCLPTYVTPKKISF